MDLEVAIVGEDLTCKGRVFQSFGAATEKAWSPQVLRHECGMVRGDLYCDLSDHTGYGSRSSGILDGALWCW